MMDKKGLSEVVTTVLLVLLALGAILLVWFLVKGQITQGSTQVTVTKGCIDVEMEAVSCTYNATAVSAAYKRGNMELSNGLVLSKVSLVFQNPDSTTTKKDTTNLPGLLETKKTIYTISSDLAGATPVKMGVAGTLRTVDGQDLMCPEAARIPCVAG